MANRKLIQACKSGNYEMALTAINEGAKDFEEGLGRACYNGHEKLALLMIEKGTTNYNWGLETARAGGREKLALLMIEKGASINDYTMKLTDIQLEYLLHKRVTDFGKSKEKAKNIGNNMLMGKRILLIVLYPDLVSDITKY